MNSLQSVLQKKLDERAALDRVIGGIVVQLDSAPPSASEADLPEGMDAKEAAKFLGLKERTVLRLARIEEIPRRKVGRHYLFSRTELRKWAACSEAAEEKGKPKFKMVRGKRG